MEIQALSPEIIQDTQTPPTVTDSIPTHLIDSTFSAYIGNPSLPFQPSAVLPLPSSPAPSEPHHYC